MTTVTLTPHRELEYNLEPPSRVFLPSAPEGGILRFTRLPYQAEPQPDSLGRLGQTVVSVVEAPHGRHYLLPSPIVVHSPAGFEWGYGGSGPADLAANVLALFVSLKEAWRLHQRFKYSVIAGLSRETPGTTDVPISLVRAWLESAWRGEREDAGLMAAEQDNATLWLEVEQDHDVRELGDDPKPAKPRAIDVGRQVYGG